MAGAAWRLDSSAARPRTLRIMVAELLVSVIPLLHRHLPSCVRLFESVRLYLTHVVITCAPDLSRRLWPWDCALARFTS